MKLLINKEDQWYFLPYLLPKYVQKDNLKLTDSPESKIKQLVNSIRFILLHEIKWEDNF